ncbi:MAG: hypothetical protein ABUS57_01885 [Pseudomonadota bacterium]
MKKLLASLVGLGLIAFGAEAQTAREAPYDSFVCSGAGTTLAGGLGREEYGRFQVRVYRHALRLDIRGLGASTGPVPADTGWMPYVTHTESAPSVGVDGERVTVHHDDGVSRSGSVISATHRDYATLRGVATPYLRAPFLPSHRNFSFDVATHELTSDTTLAIWHSNVRYSCSVDAPPVPVVDDHNVFHLSAAANEQQIGTTIDAIRALMPNLHAGESATVRVDGANKKFVFTKTNENGMYQVEYFEGAETKGHFGSLPETDTELAYGREYMARILAGQAPGEAQDASIDAVRASRRNQ